MKRSTRPHVLVASTLLAGSLACGSPETGEAGAEGAARTEEAARAETAAERARPGRKLGEVPSERYGILLSVGRKVYAPGDTIRMRLVAYNTTERPMTLRFPTAQRHDFLIRRDDAGAAGGVVWRWSDGRFFPQARGEEVLDPANPELTATARHPAPDEPGIYRVVGTITAPNWPLSATVPITVTP